MAPADLDAEAWLRRGHAACEQSRFTEALAAYDRVIALDPDNGLALFSRGKARAQLGQTIKAIADIERALALLPDNGEAHFVLGQMLIASGRIDQAAPHLERAVGLLPDLAKAHAALGVYYRQSGRPAEAVAAFDRALALEPDHAARRVQRATALLMAGDFGRGWPAYEQRLDPNTHFGRTGFRQPMWLGQAPIAGKTILVHAELGLGDTLQFCRYLPMLEAAGATVLFAPQPPLALLMRSLSPTVEIVDPADAGLEFDFHCRLLTLPLAFATQPDTIPASVPYLWSPQDRIDRWKAALGPQGFRIGVCWQGSPAGRKNGLSFPPQTFAPIAAIPGVRLISLQRGDDPAQPAAAASAGVEPAGDYFDRSADGFLDVAAIASACDLVISTDSAILHMAGALGRPTFAPLHRNSDWRWLTGRDDTPWYPSMRLFRSESWDSWANTFDRMALAVRALSEGRFA